jgi:hypothetical protein
MKRTHLVGTRVGTRELIPYFQASSSNGFTKQHLLLPTMVCGHIYGVLPSREKLPKSWYPEFLLNDAYDPK